MVSNKSLLKELVFQPWQSPYTSMDNNPINLVDPMGDEGKPANNDSEPNLAELNSSLNEDGELEETHGDLTGIESIERAKDGKYDVTTENDIIYHVKEETIDAYINEVLDGSEQTFNDWIRENGTQSPSYEGHLYSWERTWMGELIEFARNDFEGHDHGYHLTGEHGFHNGGKQIMFGSMTLVITPFTLASGSIAAGAAAIIGSGNAADDIIGVITPDGNDSFVIKLSKGTEFAKDVERGKDISQLLAAFLDIGNAANLTAKGTVTVDTPKIRTIKLIT